MALSKTFNVCCPSSYSLHFQTLALPLFPFPFHSTHVLPHCVDLVLIYLLQFKDSCVVSAFHFEGCSFKSFKTQKVTQCSSSIKCLVFSKIPWFCEAESNSAFFNIKDDWSQYCRGIFKISPPWAYEVGKTPVKIESRECSCQLWV